MKILTGNRLVNGLRELCDKVSSRIWIASPYIGNFNAVCRVLGNKWLNDPGVSVRLMSDTAELGKLSIETIKRFESRGVVKNLRGLHAKIYIIDDRAFLTSANLTATAFSKRYEVGCLLPIKESERIIRVYQSWWSKKAKKLSYEWWEGLAKKKANSRNQEEKEGESLPNLWDLPKPPKIGSKRSKAQGFLDYHSFYERHKDFCDKYIEIQRISPNMPIFLEVDGFLDYLFHHGKQPSKKYGKLKGRPILKPKTLSSEERVSQIKKYSRPFAKWVEDGHDIHWRLKASKFIRAKLKANNIRSINRKDVENIVNKLNCMNSLPLNKARFLNPENNNIRTIRKAWFVLLHDDGDLQVRMTNCRDMLRWFGKSSVQELLGFYFPKKYAIRNSNVNAGLRFFGYDVSID